MQYRRKNILSIVALCIILLFTAGDIYKQSERWQKHKVIAWDVQEYYMFLPAAFIYQDLSFNYTDNLPDTLQQRYWKGKSPIGRNVARFSMGMAICYTPFFLVSNFSAKLFEYQQNGYTAPYQFGIFISGFIYSFFGYIFLRKILLHYFQDIPAALTLICIALGTNLFYYSTTEGPMTHATLFCLFSLFLYYTIKWHDKPSYKNITILFFVGGLAILIRPISISLALVFLLYMPNGKNAFSQKISFYLSHYKQFLLGFLILLLIALPQLVYWKMQTGQWVYYSYGKEGFFFNDPKIIQGIFSFRKGWLIYTPLMLLAIAGFSVLRKRAPDAFLPILIYVIIHVYIIFSWWCWWYGGSFGMRAMIEVYAFLALPMAALWQVLWKKHKLIFAVTILFAGACIYLNQRQTVQYRFTIIHWDSMSKEYYMAVFNDLAWPSEEKLKLLSPPDYEAAMNGQRAQ